MGITAIDVNNLKILVSNYNPKSILELGSQYLYDTAENCNLAVTGNPTYGKSWFINKGIEHTSIDMNGEADLNIDITINEHNKTYDFVTDYGTIEHTNNAYLAFKNCHNWTNENGLMIHENPKTGHWPLHGNWFFTYDFYNNLATKCGYEIISLSEIAAMGNFKTGLNIYCVLKKVKDSSFNISEEQFYYGIHDK